LIPTTLTTIGRVIPVETVAELGVGAALVLGRKRVELAAAKGAAVAVAVGAVGAVDAVAAKGMDMVGERKALTLSICML
jgi:predicted dinucleotide-utilizing enzyme